MNLKSFLKRFDTEELYEIKREIDNLIEEQETTDMVRIDSLSISVRCINIFRAVGFVYLHELSTLTFKECLKIRNMGRKSMSEMTEQLILHGMSWKS